MAHSPEKRMELRAAYVGGLPLEVAADKVGVPYATARNWLRAASREGNDWDTLQRVNLMIAGGEVEHATGRIVARALMRCEALLEETENNGNPSEAVKTMVSLADTLSKLRAVGKTMMPETDALAIANEAIKGLTDLFIRMFPAKASEMLAAVEAWANGQR